MQLPICGFDAKNAILCPQCESRLDSGKITKSDVDASIKLAQLGKTNTQIDKFTLTKCEKLDDDYLLYLSKDDINAIRQSRTLYRLIQDSFAGKIWLVETQTTYKKFIEDLFFPTKIISINSVWVPGGIQKTRVIISGRWTNRFPININKVINIVKLTQNLDIEIEFEESRKQK